VAKPVGAVLKRRSRTPSEIFGKAVTELRTNENTSQVDLAATLGYSPFYLGKIERGAANVTCDVMNAIAGYFKMSIGQLWVYAENHAKKKA
jgi:transcriptional regulator with XRE-family HTH domain